MKHVLENNGAGYMFGKPSMADESTNRDKSAPTVILGYWII